MLRGVVIFEVTPCWPSPWGPYDAGAEGTLSVFQHIYTYLIYIYIYIYLYIYIYICI